ncbi:Uracil phosphoribosyltransferase [Monocercomonoides exilis]|uniref:Uracil phosphoribosyltransferase n=1 Tax=Monocercomonoides exilis TaxID=2049356 RepID=UPI00355AB7F1|nr:Uracil phosphoribosyltransferase [Monocercomonoides exilis]|eukprot:MONOS_3955.1-p1 / transcript=MONOS_3955.1 / gene=MONOS_3955 / organism=Monocercomonoides_exilis_PA203 / gene_product=Uracil phosphoribosyltransferase [EC:2.4.2.9] / transcript_product=Uracil phosphoribosyltransferase [EC:2.4.2.9] / location=Mono_scaffold00099:1571-2335(-) / protein_length=239 / sequence_SO=supercontig / SO=protein_coding / is_pseudo=false
MSTTKSVAPLPEFPQFTIVPQTPQIIALMTIMRDRKTSRGDFVFYADRLFRLLMEEGLSHLPFTKKVITTPTNVAYEGLEFGSQLCGVSIIRAGESMENALRQIAPHVRIGKILIQRKEDGSGTSQHYYTKVPKDIASRTVLLLDPMLATGGSVCCAISELLKLGVPEDRILFLNMIAAPEGVKNVLTKHPKIKIVSIALDDCLNDQKYILPGIGDFGDRYFGTDVTSDEPESSTASS